MNYNNQQTGSEGDKGTVLPLGDDTEITALLTAVRGGDNTATGRLLEKYKPLLDKSIVSFVHVYPSEKDDFSQEAMLSLYRAALTYDAGQGSVTFGAYAKTCVHNGLISYQRRLKKMMVIDESVEEKEPQTAGAQANVMDTLIRNETLQLLLQNIEKLPEKEKAVMHGVMRGRTTKDIAANLGLSTRAVESILYRTRRELRKKQS